MKTQALILPLALASLTAAGGYWWGTQHAASPAGAPVAAERKPLYYRNPMGLADTSPVPKKDAMGMDYIPVFADEPSDKTADNTAGAANQIKISADKMQKLGVRTEAVSKRALDRVVRASGRIEADERRLTTIAPKFDGYVERLHVNISGQPVGKGQPLFEVYSPELVSAQHEYALAARAVETMRASGSEAQGGMRQLAEASLQRLKNWDISAEQLQALANSGEARRTLTFRSPTSGIVTEKKAIQGMRFAAGEVLYQIADLSSVWVLADVFEQDIGQVKTGAKATIRVNAYPDKRFEGRIAYVYPTLKADTRTVQVRIELANPGLLLKPAMFAEVELPVGGQGQGLAMPLTVPDSAVIDSGSRRIVLVQTQPGRFEPREVRLGGRSDNYVEVLDGVKEGEQVVVAANFLIDAESNLKAALAGFGAAAPASAPAATTAPASSGHQAAGKIEEIDAQAGTLSISHGPVASLKWPAMTMEFKLANNALAGQLKPGAQVAFEFVERQPGEWVITSIKPAAAPAHAGH
jgi:Cu(I)/Ag(I) efflux system membrane fusion protein